MYQNAKQQHAAVITPLQTTTY